MKIEDYKVIVNVVKFFDVKKINDVCNQYPDKKVLVKIANTRGISSWQLKQLNPNVVIRIAGGYDNERIAHKGNIKFRGSKETGEYYTNAVIYTRNEVIKILETIERIERNIFPNWSDLQKVIYIYQQLKSKVMYDPMFQRKPSSEVRSLRGLITKKTVCAGYALMFKEFMDRQGINCEYVEGCTKNDGSGGHAWNIVTIDEKKYPIDLTWDSSSYRRGDKNAYDYLGQNIAEFSKCHIPEGWAKTQNYRASLSAINSNLIKIFNAQILREETYETMTFRGLRNDGSKFLIVQLGTGRDTFGQKYYRYYYDEITTSGMRKRPLILYSKSNISLVVDNRNFGRYVPDHYLDAVKNVLFSKENISQSLMLGTTYIGNCKMDNSSNKFEAVKSVSDVAKPEEIRKCFPIQTKTFRRTNGTVFIAEKVPSQAVNVFGKNVMCYHIFEMITENSELKLKRNIIFTERDFFNDQRQGIADEYLCRSRLDRKINEAGGYIGYYDVNGIKTYDPDLAKYFDISKRINVYDSKRQTARRH